MQIEPCGFLEFIYKAKSLSSFELLNSIRNLNLSNPDYTQAGCMLNNFPDLYSHFVNSQPLRRHLQCSKPNRSNILAWQWKPGDEKTLKILLTDTSLTVHTLDPYWLPYYPIIELAKNTSSTLELEKILCSFPAITLSNGIFIGGDSNPSHFFGDIFPIWIAVSNSAQLSSLPVFAYKLPSWQKALLNKITPNLNFYEISLNETAPQRPLQIKLVDCYVFEDIPQFLGWNITRAYFKDVIDKHPGGVNQREKRIYLSRRKYEISNNLEPRVHDHKLIASLMTACKFKIVYPEEHAIIDIQIMLAEATHVVSDPGSCNIHAFLSPSAATGECKSAMLGPPYIRASHRWDILRHQELLGLLGDKFFCIYGEPLDKESEGLVPSLYFKNLQEWLVSQDLHIH